RLPAAVVAPLLPRVAGHPLPDAPRHRGVPRRRRREAAHEDGRRPEEAQIVGDLLGSIRHRFYPLLLSLLLLSSSFVFVFFFGFCCCCCSSFSSASLPPEPPARCSSYASWPLPVWSAARQGKPYMRSALEVKVFDALVLSLVIVRVCCATRAALGF